MKSESVKRAEQFYTSLQERLDHVSIFPELFPLCRDQILAGRGYRIIPIGSYLLFYVLADREVQVRRVLFGRREYRDLLE